MFMILDPINSPHSFLPRPKFARTVNTGMTKAGLLTDFKNLSMTAIPSSSQIISPAEKEDAGS